MEDRENSYGNFYWENFSAFFQKISEWSVSATKLFLHLADIAPSVLLDLWQKVENMTRDSYFQSFIHSRIIGIVTVVAITSSVAMLIYCAAGKKRSKQPTKGQMNLYLESLSKRWTVYDLAKTAYEPGHSQAVMAIVERLTYDINATLPGNGLTLFLCACLSGQKELILYLINKGANLRSTTKEGDTALYLATFGVLSSSRPDSTVLEILIQKGCDVNAGNLKGYTPLHRAGAKGNQRIIKTLLNYGADPHQASASGIYPMDCAINAGHLEAAELLKISVVNQHMWDVLDPHTPPHIRLGLQSPQRKHLLESSRPHLNTTLKTI